MHRLTDQTPEVQHAFDECPRCHDTGRVVVVGLGDTPEEDISVIWPCPECRVDPPDRPSRFLGLPVPLVLGAALWLAGLILLAAAGYVLYFVGSAAL